MVILAFAVFLVVSLVQFGTKSNGVDSVELSQGGGISTKSFLSRRTIEGADMGKVREVLSAKILDANHLQHRLLIRGTNNTYSHGGVERSKDHETSFLSYSGYLEVGYGIQENWEVRGALPVYADHFLSERLGEQIGLTGIGNVKVGVKWSPNYNIKDVYVWSFLGQLHVPTGTMGRGIVPRSIEFFDDTKSVDFVYGGHRYISEIRSLFSSAYIVPMSANIGLRTILDRSLQSVVFYGVATECAFFPYFSPFFGFEQESRINKLFTRKQFATEPARWTLGARLFRTETFRLELGGTWNRSQKFQTLSFTNSSKIESFEYKVRPFVYEFFLGIQGKTSYAMDDWDKDQIANHEDKCPRKTEDKDGFLDKDGCPDYDNDGDGVLDIRDKCPNVFGTVNAHGCEEVLRASGNSKSFIKKAVAKKQTLSEKYIFSFSANRLELTKLQKRKLLYILRKVQNKSKRPIRVYVSTFTDNSGSSSQNKILSEKRAKLVKDYLILEGVDKTIIKANGYGSQRPIASNKTKEGRNKNRRVEVHFVVR